MAPRSFPIPASILTALSLPPPTDPSKTTLSPHGSGSGFTSTAHLHALVPDPANPAQDVEKHFFIKTANPRASLPDPSMEMARGEFAGLNAIADVVPGLGPRALAWGQIKYDEEKEEGEGWFLATEFLDLGGRRGKRAGDGAVVLARRLAALHSRPAPPPPTKVAAEMNIVNTAQGDAATGSGVTPQFGFPVPTFCGDVRQENAFRRSWAEFYAEQRLRSVLAESERRNGADGGLRELVERVARVVVPRLLGDGHLGYDKNGKGSWIVPVVVHGDLWSGNVGRGRVVRNEVRDANGNGDGDGEVGDIVYDPSACYAHSEFELGIMKMFGGFGRDFYEEYHRLVPKTEPIEEYSDRVSLYELYHHLNHHTIFGGGYRSGAVAIMHQLLKKYDPEWLQRI